MLIRVSETEARWAMQEGRKALDDLGWTTGYTVNVDKLVAHQVGCAAEIAVCKYLGATWSGRVLSRRHNGDVGQIEVRCARKGKALGMLLNARDWPKRTRKFIYVESLGYRKFLLKGWAYGYEVMQPENIFERPQFVERIWRLSNEKLRKMETIKEE